MDYSKLKRIPLLQIPPFQIPLYRLSFYTFALIAGLYIFTPNLFSGQFNGFDIGQSPLIPLNEIRHGGPPKDGIPAIDEPEFISADAADFLQKTDRIVGTVTKEGAKAYPIRILNWHEIVNDGDTVISYCPLCGTAMAFKSAPADFGVSGLLYNSDMLLYDRKTESLWSQILGKAISGERKGELLETIPVENTSWENWLNLHPNTQVLSENTGYRRNYSASPYAGYESSKSLYFPVSGQNQRYHPKEKVIGLNINGTFKAYPFSELDKSKNNIVRDKLDGKEIEIIFNAQHRSGTVRLKSGEVLPSLISYWFAWYAFHPDTLIYNAEKN